MLRFPVSLSDCLLGFVENRVSRKYSDVSITGLGGFGKLAVSRFVYAPFIRLPAEQDGKGHRRIPSFSPQTPEGFSIEMCYNAVLSSPIYIGRMLMPWIGGGLCLFLDHFQNLTKKNPKP